MVESATTSSNIKKITETNGFWRKNPDREPALKQPAFYFLTNFGKRMKAQFIHTSMYGSYYASCEVIRKNKNKSRIKYIDPFTKEVYSRWVDNEDIKWPRSSIIAGEKR